MNLDKKIWIPAESKDKGAPLYLNIEDVKQFFKKLDDIEPCASQEIFISRVRERAGKGLT